ncbi:MAG: FHA domain-containing protein [Chloroflexi bacterium]|nr:FHA domain-containing protein [Chloroflexota bacterium]
MMEMLEENIQSSDEVDVHAALDEVLSLLKKGISEPVIAVYKNKLNATLDLQAIRGILETTQPDLDTKRLTEKTAVEQLDLDAWLNLILQRWDIFDPILKSMGKDAVEKLRDIHLERLDDGQLSTREARNTAILAHEMLSQFYCKPQADRVAVIRDQLTALAQAEDVPVVEASAKPAVPPSTPAHPTPEKANGHWAGVGEKAAPAPSTNGNHKHEPVTVSSNSNGNGTHAKAESLPQTEILSKDGVEAKPAPRIDKSRTHRVAPPSPNSVLQVEIVKQRGDASAQRIDLSKPSVLVGRSLMADIEVSDPRVSRVHLLIAGTPESGIKVTDLHSANGTFMDGIPLIPNSPTEWDIGQMVTIGETLLILRHTI